MTLPVLALVLFTAFTIVLVVKLTWDDAYFKGFIDGRYTDKEFRKKPKRGTTQWP